jgi:very-short-patch-repair endonuclease
MTYKQITELARSLRKNQTPEEEILWELLRNRRCGNLKFNRQFPIVYGTYKNKPLCIIVDFYCAQYRLILELDGKIHDHQKEYDSQRDLLTMNMDYNILRIKNEELVDLTTVINKILGFVKILKPMDYASEKNIN